MGRIKMGMPTLIELNSMEENIKLCRQLGLDFIELNMNLPEYQSKKIDCDHVRSLVVSNDIFFTIHLPEEFDIANFSDVLRNSYKKIFMETVKVAKQLMVPVINMHMNPGVYFTLPSEKIYLYDKYKERYLHQIKVFINYARKLLQGSSIKLSIENTGILGLKFVQEGLELLLKEDFVELTWDVGHDYTASHVDYPFYEKYRHKVRHMHLHDGTDRENHLDLGKGTIDLISNLEFAQNNCRTCVIEVKTVEGLVESVEWLGRHLDAKTEVVNDQSPSLLENLKPTTRFSNRVEDYAKYRPHYPTDVVDTLRKVMDVSERTVITDIGSGTGIFTQRLLDLDTWIYGVEPNDDMRKYAENNPIFDKTIVNSEIKRVEFIKGTSDSTHLDSECVDLITVAQAFHWFEPESTKKEFLRILKDNGYLLLIWNDRKIEGQGFSFDYEEILKANCHEYKIVTHKNIEESQLKAFYEPFEYERFDFENSQQFDFDALLGRAKSSSYVPIEDKEIMDKIKIELRQLFDRYQNDGQVRFEYITTMYLGRLK